MPKLNESELLKKYHELFTLIVEDSRIMPKSIAKKLRYSGQGKARSTILYHLKNMYKKQISLKPQLKILPFSNLEKWVYFCRKVDKKNIYETFLELHSNKDVSFVECLSGSDFFVTSFSKDIDFGVDFLAVEEKSKFYRSLYLNPRGWNKKPAECFSSLLSADYQEGKVERKDYGLLNWSDTDKRIYFLMRKNIRCKFTYVGRHARIDSKTAKKRFYENVLPQCDVAHYFFPKGRGSYREMFLKMKTDYETSLIDALCRLPCTTYVYPLETQLVTVLFHQDEKLILSILQKLKEIGIIKDYLFYIPLIHGVKE
jgi:hypothetical protein